MRVGLFGGTFNPVHLGHLRAAEEIREILGLDRVIFIPAHVPPHKKNGIAPAQDRFAMVGAAIRDNPHFAVSDIELQRRGKSYSYETVGHFREQFGPGAELFFMMGIDAFREIRTWRRYPDFFSLCSFAVMSRPGVYDPEPEKHIPADLARLCSFNRAGGFFEHPSGHRIYFSAISLLDISSTGIRQAVREGRSVKYLVPDSVAEYIFTCSLYH